MQCIHHQNPSEDLNLEVDNVKIYSAIGAKRKYFFKFVFNFQNVYRELKVLHLFYQLSGARFPE